LNIGNFQYKQTHLILTACMPLTSEVMSFQVNCQIKHYFQAECKL